jgi:hypothetical protein
MVLLHIQILQKVERNVMPTGIVIVYGEQTLTLSSDTGNKLVFKAKGRAWGTPGTVPHSALQDALEDTAGAGDLRLSGSRNSTVSITYLREQSPPDFAHVFASKVQQALVLRQSQERSRRGNVPLPLNRG